MVPAFGFSVGDFVAVIQLINKISKAVRDAGGAVEDYQDTVSELESLKEIFKRLDSSHTLPPWGENLSLPIKAHTESVLESLTRFSHVISKFDSKLGKTAPKGWTQGSWKKVQWSIQYAKEVEKLRVSVGTCLSALNLLVDLEDRDVQAKTNEQLSSMIANLQHELLRTGDSATNAISDVQKELRDGYLIHKSTMNDQTQKIENVAFQVNTFQQELIDLRQEIIRLQSRVVNHDSAAGSQSSSLAALQDLKAVSGSSLDGKTGVKTLLYTASSPNSRDELKVQVKEYLEYISKLLTLLILGARNLLTRLWLFYPFAVHFIRVLQTTISRAPFLLASDSINFEDALGRRFKLPHEYFKHWGVFKSFLDCQFKKIPGEIQVLAGDFLLLDSKDETIVIRKPAWGGSIFPGRTITMSIAIRTLQGSDQICSRVDCRGKCIKVPKKPLVQCSICHMYLYLKLDTGPSEAKRLLYDPDTYPYRDPDARQQPQGSLRGIEKTSAKEKPPLLQKPFEEASRREETEISKFKKIHLTNFEDKKMIEVMDTVLQRGTFNSHERTIDLTLVRDHSIGDVKRYCDCSSCQVTRTILLNPKKELLAAPSKTVGDIHEINWNFLWHLHTIILERTSASAELAKLKIKSLRELVRWSINSKTTIDQKSWLELHAENKLGRSYDVCDKEIVIDPNGKHIILEYLRDLDRKNEELQQGVAEIIAEFDLLLGKLKEYPEFIVQYQKREKLLYEMWDGTRFNPFS